MTQLLLHTVAHSTRPSFRPKTNNQPTKKFLSLAVTWVKVVKMCKILTFKVNFLCQKWSVSFYFLYLEVYHLRSTFLLLNYEKQSSVSIIKACNFINLGTWYKGAEVAPNSYLQSAGAHSGLLLGCKMTIKMAIWQNLLRVKWFGVKDGWMCML